MIAPFLLALTLATAGASGITWAYQANKYERVLADQRLEFSRAHINALEVAHAETIRLQDQAAQAAQAAAVRLNKLTADRAALRVVVERLRDDTTTARDRLPSAPAPAVVEYSLAVNELYGKCARELERMGHLASGHASDVRTLLDAWPRAKGD